MFGFNSTLLPIFVQSFAIFFFLEKILPIFLKMHFSCKFSRFDKNFDKIIFFYFIFNEAKKIDNLPRCELLFLKGHIRVNFFDPNLKLEIKIEKHSERKF